MAEDMYGGNLQQMDSLSKQFTTQGQAVDSLVAAIDKTLHSTAWTGPFANKFRSEWNGTFKTALRNLRSSLDEASKVVHQRRQAIDTATK